jgi:hypothetical protein
VRRLLCAVLLLAACGGDDDAGGDAVELQSIASIDPCGLLPPAEASRLTGGEVELDDTPAASSLGAAVGCSYRFTEETEVAGAALAASITVVEPELPPLDALELIASTADDDGFDRTEIEVGDGGTTIVSPDEVQVVTVVETVVVIVTVVPVDGAVEETLVDDVVAFTETTVEPVRDALAGGGPAQITAGELEGLWTGDWGTMALQVDGDRVIGAYTHDDGRIVGTFANGVLVGRWTEVPTRAEPNDAGDVEFRFTKTAEGLSLDGRWRYGSEGEFSEDWDLVLSDEEVPEELVAAFEDEASFEEGSG